VGAWTAAESVMATGRRLVLTGIGQWVGRKSPARVDELMSTGVKTCSPRQSLADAAQIMWECDCGCVPVVDASGRVAGMITDRDICMSAYFRGATLREIAIADAMSRRVLAVRPNDSVQDAEALMRRVQVRRLPVADAEGRLLGMLSLGDIAIAAEGRGRSRGSRGPAGIDLREVALTLSAVSKERAVVGRHSDRTPS